MNKRLLFASGGGSYKQTADTLATNDTVEVLLGISEGPIKGPINGPQSFYLDDTPLINSNGSPNFSAFSLDFWPGSPTGDTVAMLTGGFSSPTQVGQALYYNEPVARQGVQTNITAVDFIINISNLEHSDAKGTGTENLKLLFEYCPQGGEWAPCFTTAANTTNTSATTTNNWSSDGILLISSFSEDRPITTNTGVTTPAATTTNALSIDESGNVYHWDTGSLAWVQAAMTAGTSNYAQWVDVEGNQNITRKVYKQSATAPTSPSPDAGDIWIQNADSYLIYNGAAWVQPEAYNNYVPTQQALTNGVWSINAKVTTTTSVTIRCFLPASTEPFQYRVTKQVPDDTTTDFTDVSWDSFGEIKQTSWTFTSLAMLHVLGQASDQFTSLPNWSADLEGRLVKVPSNYDPVARTYTGVWDGTYKVAYTNSPVWCFKDFVENNTYGLSSVYPHVCNPWSLYNWAQFCDVMVPTAAGGTQPRYTYNDFMATQRDAREAANYIAGAAAAIMVDDGAGGVDVYVDDPSEAAIAIFTQENISPDGFAYSYTDRLTRANQIVVSFANPNVNWQTDKRIVENDTDIASYGLITDDIVAVGCIDPDEALRRARQRLISGLTEKEMVQFSTDRKGKYLAQWNVILVADPTLGRGLSGRINSVIDASTVKLRDAITLEAGFTYTAYFDCVNPGYPGNDELPLQTVALPISTPAGTVTELAFSGTLPTLAEYAVFAIECDQVIGSPKPYRITNIEDQGGDGENIVITALEVNRSKQAYIDGVTDQVVDPSYSSVDDSFVAPPTNLQTSVSIQQVGLVSTRVLTLSWTASVSDFVNEYTVYTSLNGAPSTSDSTSQTSIDLGDINGGVFTFEVVATNVAGVSSAPVTLIFDATGVARYVDPPTNLVLVGGDSPTTFNTLDATFAWKAGTLDPLFDHYQVTVLDTTSGTVYRTTNVGSALTWTYDYGSNTADGLHRAFTVDVQAVDQDGNESAPISIAVDNPPPTVPADISYNVSPTALLMRFTPPPAPDYAGVNVWASATNNFTVGPATLVWEGPGQPTIFGNYNSTIYICYQFYDAFGTVGCPISAEQAENLTFLEVLQGVQTIVDQAQSLVDQAATTESNVEDLAQQMLEAEIESGQNFLALHSLTYTTQGLPVGPVAESQQITQTDLVAAMSLLGVVSPDGSAFILNTSTAYYADGVSLAEQFSQLQANITGVSTTLTTQYMTSAQVNSAITTASQTLNSTIAGVSSNLTNNYLTSAQVNSAISASQQTLQSSINGVSSNLTNNYLTSAQTAAAISSAQQTLQSSINGVSSNLTNNYLTSAQTTAAISAAQQTLQSSINGVSSNLTNNYWTATTTNNAIANMQQTLQANINGVSSTVSTQGSAVSNLQNQAYATWGVLVDANGEMAGFQILTANGPQTLNEIRFNAAVTEITGDLIVDGSIYTPQLQNQAVTTVPLIMGSSAQTLGPGSTETTIYEGSIILDAPGTIFATGDIAFSDGGGHAAASHFGSASLYINGNIVAKNVTTGTATFPGFSIAGSYYFSSAGTYDVKMTITLANFDYYNYGSLFAIGYKK